MPLPWLVNQWGCNPWQTEPDRRAAADTETLSVLPPLTEEQVRANQEPEEPAGFWSISPAEWAETLRKDWPEKGPVIPEADQIQESDQTTVLEWVNKSRAADKQKTNLQCFDYAHYQVSAAGYGVSGPGHKSPTTITIFVEHVENGVVREEVLEEEVVTAVSYLKESLQAGIPVLIGVRLKLFDSRPNDYKATDYREATNHFVVAVGMGTDDEGSYFSYYDYMHGFRDDDRLYLRDDLTLTTAGGYRTLTEVRRSTKY